MAVLVSIASGSSIAASLLIRVYSLYPPSFVSLKPEQAAMTLSPGLNLESLLSKTSPATSTPPISGKVLSIFPAPVAAKASL